MNTKIVFLVLSFCLPALGLAQVSDESFESELTNISSIIDRESHVVLIVEAANKFLREYAQLSPEEQKRLAFVAVPTAAWRRAGLRWLIQHAPEAAIRLSLSPGERQGLPKYVLRFLEERIHAIGDLTQSITEDLPLGDSQSNEPPQSVVSWTARVGEDTFRAFVYGLRERHETKYDTPVHGIVIGDLMAVDEDPLYQFDDFEVEQLGFPPGTIVATSGEIPIVFPDSFALEKLRQELIALILQFGPRPALQVPSWTTGDKRVLVIKADYSDNTDLPYTDAVITSVMSEASTFFEENSYGSTSLTATILPAILRLPLTSATYAAMDEDAAHIAIGSAAQTAARDYDAMMGGTGAYDPDAFDRVLVLTPQVFGNSVGKGDVGGNQVVITSNELLFTTVAHEFGHTWGFVHSAFWFINFGDDPVGPGTHHEYGDVWDMMGSPTLDGTDAEPRRRHFNVYFKWRSRWFPLADFVDASAGGTFRLYRHDSETATGLRGIKIDASDGNTYFLGLRRNFPWNSSMFNGIEVRRLTPAGLVQLLDIDNMAGTSIEHSLRRLRTFTDASNGISIRAANVVFDATGHYADVEITVP